MLCCLFGRLESGTAGITKEIEEGLSERERVRERNSGDKKEEKKTRGEASGKL